MRSTKENNFFREILIIRPNKIKCYYCISLIQKIKLIDTLGCLNDIQPRIKTTINEILVFGSCVIE